MIMTDGIDNAGQGASSKRWLRSGITTALIISIFIGGFWLVSTRRQTTSTETAAPKLVLPSCPLYLGKGEPGDILTGTVPIWNTGATPLHIEKLEASCGCASLSISEKVIPPGEKAVLHVGARLRANEETLGFGVLIYSNASNSPSRYLVEAGVKQIVRIEPLEINFGAVPVGKEVSQTLRIHCADGKSWLPAEKLTVESRRGLIRAEVSQPDRGNASSTVKIAVVKAGPNLPTGAFLDWLVLHPSYTDRTVEVKVQGYIVPPILISPSTLYFNNDKSELTSRERRIILRRSDENAIGRVVKIESPEGINVKEMVSSSVHGERDTRLFTVTLTPKFRNTEENPTIHIKMEHDEVLVRVVVNIEGKR
jgi:hypothetical protein